MRNPQDVKLEDEGTDAPTGTNIYIYICQLKFTCVLHHVLPKALIQRLQVNRCLMHDKMPQATITVDLAYRNVWQFLAIRPIPKTMPNRYPTDTQILVLKASVHSKPFPMIACDCTIMRAAATRLLARGLINSGALPACKHR